MKRAAGVAALVALVLATLLSTAGAQQGGALSGEFVGVPLVHDGSEFTFELRFTPDEPEISYTVFFTSVLDISGGTLSAVSRVNRGRNDRWNLTVEPDDGHAGDIVITLAATQSCDDANSICSSDDEPLAEAVTATIAGPGDKALSGEFVGVPLVHDGSEFTFELRFTPDEPEISYTVFFTSVLDISGGTLSAVSRVNRGRNDRWNLTVEPDDGHAGDIVITLAATQSCDDANSICSSDDEPLAEAVTATIAGPGDKALSGESPEEAQQRGEARTVEVRGSSTVTLSGITVEGTAIPDFDADADRVHGRAGQQRGHRDRGVHPHRRRGHRRLRDRRRRHGARMPGRADRGRGGRPHPHRHQRR